MFQKWFTHIRHAITFYRPQTKLREGNVFTPVMSVILFTGGGLYPPPSPTGQTHPGRHPQDRHSHQKDTPLPPGMCLFHWILAVFHTSIVMLWEKQSRRTTICTQISKTSTPQAEPLTDTPPLPPDTHTPRWQLKWTVRILLECIIVSSVYTNVKL